MGPKAFLVLMTVVAVVTDSMLHPFYPQYFEKVFGVLDPRQVGLYIGACSLTVMLAFPLWALLSGKIPVLRLLIGTQLATAALSLACYAITSLPWFWIVSLCMMVFKASYLLIYPYVMSLENKEHHVGTISLLAFVVYFGNILAALLSGVLFELADARLLFVAMACGDAVQIGLCLALMRAPLPSLEEGPAETDPAAPIAARPRLFAYKLGSVMLVLYFSAYLTEPFFSAYWEELSAIGNKIVTGFVFAIPGVAALAGLYLNSRKRSEDGAPYSGILPAIVVGICSLWLQASGSPAMLLAGRFLYGLALFQSMVRLDALLFRFSTPESYSVDFSKINIFQALGIQIASLAAGSLVASLGMKSTFLISMGGFLLGALLYRSLFHGQMRQRRGIAPEPTPVGAQEAIT